MYKNKIYKNTNMIKKMAILGLLGILISPNLTAQTSIFTDHQSNEKTKKLSEQSTVEERHLEIVQSKVEILEGLSPDRIAIGDGDLLDVKVLDNGQLLLIGQAIGTTSLRVWSLEGKEYNYHVIVRPQEVNMDITMRKVIRMRVKMIEFRASTLREIGIDWIKSASGPAFGIATNFGHNLNVGQGSTSSIGGLLENGFSLSSFFGASSIIDSTINFMEESGDASILAEPTLSCLSGENASFVAGGEVPFSVVGKNGETNVSFKKYGIMLEVSPYADRNGRIYTSIQTEVSQIDPSVSVHGAPGFLTRRTETHMNVVSGQTIVISGLLSKNTSNTIENIPGIKNVPVLGRLFESKKFQNNQTQLVILVTPELVDPEQQWKNKTYDRVQQPILSSSRKVQNILDKSLSDISIQFRY